MKKIFVIAVLFSTAFFVLPRASVILVNHLQGIPYDRRNPVIYDNDEVIDVYTDDYIMALAGAGDINLAGIITSTSIAPFNRYCGESDFERVAADRVNGVNLAKAAGFKNIPDPVYGTKGHLQSPLSGKVEDTRPIGSEGSRLIVREARRASCARPLVLVMGGPLTVAADAYLLDNSIADKIIVAWLGGRPNDMGGYNGWADPWAAFIVLQKLRLVQFSEENMCERSAPSVPKSRLTELPDTPLRTWMIKKRHPSQEPSECDADAPPAIALMLPEYPFFLKIMRIKGVHFRIFRAKRVSFSRWVKLEDGREVPAFKETPFGRAIVFPDADKNAATREWWRALKNKKAYGL